MFLDYIGPRFSIVPNLWKMFFNEAVIIFSLFIALNVTIFIAILKSIKKFDRKFLFFVTFYLVFLIPIIFFPNNKYPFHETVSLAGFAIALSFILSKSSKILTFITVIIFILLSYNSVILTLRTHWLIGRAKIVDSVLTPFLKSYPALPKDTVIYIKNDPNYPKINDQWGGTAKQAYMALSGENSFKVYYKDATPLPKTITTPKFIEFPAVIPY